MNHFIYVFTEKERDVLLASNFALIKSDEYKKIYVFENKEELCFDLQQVNAVFSDTLTF